MTGVLREHLTVELQLGPEANVTRRTAQIVADQFAAVGIPVSWVPLLGDRSRQLGPDASAEPSLHVRLRASCRASSAEMIAAAGPQLAAAVARVRQMLPQLPLGIETVNFEGRRRFFAFAHADGPEAIANGMSLMEAAASTDAGALAWDAGLGTWREL